MMARRAGLPRSNDEATERCWVPQSGLMAAACTSSDMLARCLASQAANSCRPLPTAVMASIPQDASHNAQPRL